MDFDMLQDVEKAPSFLWQWEMDHRAEGRRRVREDGGYLLGFATNVTSMTSSFVVLDAKKFSSDPVAIAELPRRIPPRLSRSVDPQGAHAKLTREGLIRCACETTTHYTQHEDSEAIDLWTQGDKKTEER
eukprot:scaffold888_cov246-Pinguiococcus_pyrenoidosus.AAC.2